MASGRINQVPIVSRHSLNHVWCHRSFPLDREGLSPLRLTSACSCCVAQHPTQGLGETGPLLRPESTQRVSTYHPGMCEGTHTPSPLHTWGLHQTTLQSRERWGCGQAFFPELPCRPYPPVQRTSPPSWSLQSLHRSHAKGASGASMPCTHTPGGVGL